MRILYLIINATCTQGAIVTSDVEAYFLFPIKKIIERSTGPTCLDCELWWHIYWTFYVIPIMADK